MMVPVQDLIVLLQKLAIEISPPSECPCSACVNKKECAMAADFMIDKLRQGYDVEYYRDFLIKLSTNIGVLSNLWARDIVEQIDMILYKDAPKPSRNSPNINEHKPDLKAIRDRMSGSEDATSLFAYIEALERRIFNQGINNDA